jgi:hypothetical protein
VLAATSIARSTTPFKKPAADFQFCLKFPTLETESPPN